MVGHRRDARGFTDPIKSLLTLLCVHRKGVTCASQKNYVVSGPITALAAASRRGCDWSAIYIISEKSHMFARPVPRFV